MESQSQSMNESRPPFRRSNTLSVANIPETATVLTIAKACENFMSFVRGIRIVKNRANNSRSAMIDFITTQQCECTKEANELFIDGISYPMHYARSRDSQNYTLSVSETKLYVRYPEEADGDEIRGMFKNLQISTPENARNYFFATCKNRDEQHELIRALDKQDVDGGKLQVSVAFDKQHRTRNPVRSAN